MLLKSDESKKPRPVKGRGFMCSFHHLLQRTNDHALSYCPLSLSCQGGYHTVSGNGGMPSAPTALSRFGPKLGSDVPRFPTHTGLAPPPARCDFEKSGTVFFNAFAYKYWAYYSIGKMELSRQFLTAFFFFVTTPQTKHLDNLIIEYLSFRKL